MPAFRWIAESSSPGDMTKFRSRHGMTAAPLLVLELRDSRRSLPERGGPTDSTLLERHGERTAAPRTCTFLPSREWTVKEPVCSDMTATTFLELSLLPDKSRAIGIAMA
tara:strand:- start:67 stop:393 length:327 start_codon:yes stop_codon:yes gene_type:complete